MRGLAAAIFLMGVAIPQTAFAAEKGDHTGLNLGGDLGFQNVRGKFFNNDIKPGPALKLQIGYRIVPQFSLETGLAFATGESKQANETVSFLHILNLDARFFPLGAGKIEPNFLAGYTLGSAATIESGGTTFTFTGYSPTLGAGLRFHASDLLYVQGDFRYLYTRYTDVDASGGGIEFDGPLSRQEHGDAFMILAGAGLQF